VDNTSGTENTAFGDEAGSSITTGSFNTSIGRAANTFNTTGNYNTVLGYVAGIGPNGAQSNSTAIGALSQVGCSNCLVLGSIAGLNGATSDVNVGISRSDPSFPLSFADKVGDKISLWGSSGAHYGIGVQSLLLQIHTDIATSDIAFGYGSSSSFNENMRIKGNGNVGIGNSNPPSRLYVQDGSSGYVGGYFPGIVMEGNGPRYLSLLTPNANENGLLFGLQSNASHGGIVYNNASNLGGMQFRTNGNNTRMVIDASGNVGIGTTAPTQKLHVAGNICATGSIGSCSDIRYKINVLPLTHALGNVLRLQAIYYNWNTAAFPDLQFTDEKQIGFSAQEVEKIYPELVMTDANGYKAVDYGKFTPLLVQAIKEQQQEINDLKKDIAELKALLIDKPANKK
jgi:hypothetical protein